MNEDSTIVGSVTRITVLYLFCAGTRSTALTQGNRLEADVISFVNAKSWTSAKDIQTATNGDAYPGSLAEFQALTGSYI
jgi:hypothetical protein